MRTVTTVVSIAVAASLITGCGSEDSGTDEAVRPSPSPQADSSELELVMIESVGGWSFDQLAPLYSDVMTEAFQDTRNNVKGITEETYTSLGADETLAIAQQHCDAVAAGATWPSRIEVALQPAYDYWDARGGVEDYYDFSGTTDSEELELYFGASTTLFRISPMVCPDQYDEILEAATDYWYWSQPRGVLNDDMPLAEYEATRELVAQEPTPPSPTS